MEESSAINTTAEAKVGLDRVVVRGEVRMPQSEPVCMAIVVVLLQMETTVEARTILDTVGEI